MTLRLLLCTDLDRTLIPNGVEPESSDARPRFRRFVAHPGVTLVYVTGRHRALVQTAITEYLLPQPDYLIGDVGTSLYQVDQDRWEPLSEWQEVIGREWVGIGGPAVLARCFEDIDALRLQEPEKQGPLKLSYYTPVAVDVEQLKSRMRARLTALGLMASLIWSIDEAAATGLLDVLPGGATKFHAIDFLMRRLGHDASSTVFAGDSGNDLEVLASAIPAVLVANGHPEVRSQALRLAEQQGHAERLYCARGGWAGMNGCYGAGILEGVAHFRPHLAEWLND